MQKYFIHLQEQEGPFTLDQLKTKEIKSDTPVWFDGLEEWKKAADVEELKSLFVTTPPPFLKKDVSVKPPPFLKEVKTKAENKVATIAEKLENYHPKWEKTRVYWKWVLGIAVAVIAAVIIIPIAQKEVTKANFRNNPASYVRVDRSFKYNSALGGIWDLKIQIANNSQFNLDEVRCVVSYIRKNGELFKEEQVISGYISAYGNIEINAPNSTAGMDVNVRVIQVRSIEAGAN